jgi:AraC-like DNA-binding protein
MAVLFDATELPAADRNAALEDIFDQIGVPTGVTNRGPAEKVSTRLHHWKFGANDLFLAQGAGLRLTRTPAQVRAAAPEAIRVGFQISGTYTLTVGGYDEARGAGHVNFTDKSLPCEFTQYGAAASVASFELSYDQLGFPVDVLRKAGRILPSSPVYALVQGHMAGLCRRADALARDTSAGTIGDATLELVRAMISSAGEDDDLRTNSVMNETLYTRIVAFIHNNLTDPGLSPERIAREHYISVRQLYELWAHKQLSLSEWIMSERLEGARRALAVHASTSATIGAIARRWGFRDSAHFSRRFRAAYGLTPREWRQLNQAASASPGARADAGNDGRGE